MLIELASSSRLTSAFVPFSLKLNAVALAEVNELPLSIVTLPSWADALKASENATSVPVVVMSLLSSNSPNELEPVTLITTLSSTVLLLSRMSNVAAAIGAEHVDADTGGGIEIECIDRNVHARGCRDGLIDVQTLTAGTDHVDVVEIDVLHVGDHDGITGRRE